MSLRLLAALAIFALSQSGCAERAWTAARSADTTDSYHRFLREHADSQYAGEASARLAMARVRSKPTRETFEAFRSEFPDPELIAELRPHVEEAFFAQARLQGTPGAYRSFVAHFPDGSFAARARGNAEYLEQGGFAGRLDALQDFAARHPASDYAAEAERSVAAASLRHATAFRRVGFVLDLPPSTPGADRLARVFAERAREAYQAAGLELVPAAGPEEPHLAGVGAVLTISHREEPVRTRIQGGSVAQSGTLARTTVTLAQPGNETPIWSDTFELRAPAAEQRPGASVLFGAGSTMYWSEFFVPVASWNTRDSVRGTSSFDKPPVAVEMLGSRAVVLFGDGDVQVLDVGDPVSPVRVAEYRRPRDLSRFQGLAVGQSRIAAFGPDGIEILRLGAQGLEREAVYGREVVGSVVGAEALGDELLAAGTRGLLWIQPGVGAPRRMLGAEILGLARTGERLLFTDGSSLYVSTRELLAAGRIEGELRLGRAFRPARVRGFGTSAVVLGDRSVAWVDLSIPSQPRLLSRMGVPEVGEVRDATVVGGRLFLLGARGLQVADPSGRRVVDSADVLARDRLGAGGRHLVAVGGESLQVVDVTPFLVTAGAAAPR